MKGSFQAVVDEEGRLVVPAEVCERAGLAACTRLVLVEMVTELLAERRAAAAAELVE